MFWLTERLICVSCFWKPYGRDWPMARILPVPGSTIVAAVATLSLLLTWSLIDAWADSCAFGSSVVRIVRPPRFHTLARAARVLPNVSSLRKTSRT